MELNEDVDLTASRLLTDQFNDEDGRRPRLLLAALGEQADERALRLYAAAYADAGFDIDVCPLKQNPVDTARMAAENDVHAIGICGLKAEESGIITAIQEELARLERADIPSFVRLPASSDALSCELLARFDVADDGSYRAEVHHIIQKLTEYYL